MTREDKLARCLVFFASVIKSGEQWSAECERNYRDALDSPSSPPKGTGDICHPDLDHDWHRPFIGASGWREVCRLCGAQRQIPAPTTDPTDGSKLQKCAVCGSVWTGITQAAALKQGKYFCNDPKCAPCCNLIPTHSAPPSGPNDVKKEGP